MSIIKEEPIEFLQGKTYRHVLRVETTPLVSKPIQGITRAGIAAVSCLGHNMPDGWKGTFSGVEGMTEINAPYPNRLRPSDFQQVTLLDANTVELPFLDTTAFRAYKSGGFLRYYTPMNLAGYTARMSIKDRKGGTELFSLTSVNGRILIDNIAKTLTLLVSAIDTAAMTWKKGVYELELVSGDTTPIVTRIMFGPITLTTEVTTT